MRRIESYILSYDTILGLIALILGVLFVPDKIENSVCVAIYGTAIAVLSIIFSIFFASLAVILAFPDNEFIVFIEKGNKLFSRMLAYFKATLFILFISLIFNIVIYIHASLNGSNTEHNRPIFLTFLFVFTYSLIATITAVIVTLKLTQSRSDYLAKKIELEAQRELEVDLYEEENEETE
ncbi:hypothetical protein [Spirosoma agri]|uniref:Uncharacterized protein n=1 Tax=Spirosoma agri TaxID=1987381 RepID=A0A6M0IF39_9BACT|nr:hypothetical protein [Spirosoma agri]NEU65951.1 hypothetical protein [Spirosoma agri]